MDRFGITLRFSLETSLLTDEPMDMTSQYRVEVLQDEETVAGHFTVYRFELNTAINQRVDLVDVFDSFSQETYDFFEHLYDHDRQEWKESLGEEINALDILYFQWAEFPEDLARSTGVLAAAERIIQVLGASCSIAALWPWEDPHASRKTDASEESLSIWATCDSELFWKRLGFRKFEDTPILVRDLRRREPFPIAKLLEADD